MLRTIKTIASAILVAGFAATPAAAKDLPKNAKPVSEADYIKLLSGRTLKGSAYGGGEEKIATFTVEFRKDGTKLVTVTPKGKKANKKTLKWYVKNGKFCDQLYATEKVQCGTKGLFFKAGNTCYITTADKKSISSELRC